MGGALRAAAPGAFCSPCSAPHALPAPHVLYANVLHANQQIARKKQAPMLAYVHPAPLPPPLLRRQGAGSRQTEPRFGPQTITLKLFSEQVSTRLDGSSGSILSSKQQMMFVSVNRRTCR